MSWHMHHHHTARCPSVRSGYWHATGPARALCIFLPGLGDFLEKRSALAERLAAAGDDILSLDWCGQGGSGHHATDPQAAHVEDFINYVDDVVAVVQARRSVELPIWLLGYSMGATVALYALLMRRLDPAALVLVSPMLKLPLPVPEAIGRAVARTAELVGQGFAFAPGEQERAGAMGTLPTEVVDDGCRARLDDMVGQFPDFARRGVTWGWSRAALAAMAKVRRMRWQQGPVLIVTATGEMSVDLKPVPALARRMGGSVVTLPGGHDLFLAAPSIVERLYDQIEQTVSMALASRGAGK